MPVDPNVFNNIKTFADYQRAQDEFDQRKMLVAQQLQTGGIDALTKQNVLATQLLSGAADQPTYEAAKAKLGQMGIDTSTYAPDFATGSQQAQQARLAQSPLGSLLNAGLKSQSNLIGLGGLTGQIPPGAENPLGALGLPGVNIVPRAPIAPQAVAPQSRPPAAGPSPAINPNGIFTDTLTQANNIPANALPNSIPRSIGDINSVINATPEDQTPTVGGKAFTAAPVAPAPTSIPIANNAPGTGFTFRAQNPNETLAAYKDAQQQAFDQFKYNNEPGRAEQKAVATKGGEDLADSIKTVHAIQSTLPIAIRRFNDMRIASQDANYGTGTDLKADFYSNFKDSPTAKANTYLRQQVAQATLPELGPQLQGMKGNKFLEGLANNSSGLDITAPPDAKIGAVNGLENNYISQLRIAAAKVRAAGGKAPTDAEIDKEVADLKAKAPKTLTSAEEANAPTAPKTINWVVKDGKLVQQ